MRPLELALEEIVGEDDGLAEIVEEMADRVAAHFGDNRDVALRDRFQRDAIDEQIEVEDLAVDRLERVVRLVELGPGGGVAGRRCAAGEREHAAREEQRRGAIAGEKGLDRLHVIVFPSVGRAPPNRGIVDNAVAECNSNFNIALGPSCHGVSKVTFEISVCTSIR